MDTAFIHRPLYSHLVVDFEPGEAIVAEPGATVGHSSTVTIETTSSCDGIVTSAVSRRCLGARA